MLLIIGSQCDVLTPLDFVPACAEELYGILTDPAIGVCESAFEDTESLLLDGTVDDIRQAIKAAFKIASEQGDTLILALIGHGVGVGKDFFYMAKNSPNPPMSDEAVHLVQIVKDCYRRYSFLDSLIILVDTCYSGVAAIAAAESWIKDLGDLPTRFRFEVMTSAGQENAYNGCFSKVLINTLSKGLAASLSETLLCRHMTPVVDRQCGNLQETDHVARKPDDGLFLAKNVAQKPRHQPWVRTPLWDNIEVHTKWFQPTPPIRQLVEASDIYRCLAITGLAGSGKSALMASLAQPEVTEGAVPDHFVQAIVFISEATDSTFLAETLSSELQSSVDGFTGALDRFKESVTLDEWNKMEAMQRSVAGPLRLVQVGRPVRIIIDALDQLPESATQSVYRTLNMLASDQGWEHVRLVVTARLDTVLPTGAKQIQLGIARDEDIQTYLVRRDVPENYRPLIIANAAGSWLIARLLANLTVEQGVGPKHLQGELVDIYDRVLLTAGATRRNALWRENLRPLLGVLAISGIGAILPIPLLFDAGKRLGGPQSMTLVRDLLVDMRGFIDRRSPGTEDERVGLFHASFADYLLNRQGSTFYVEEQEARESLVSAINELAPMNEHDPQNPLCQYAAAAEAEQLWALGQYPAAFESLEKRSSPIPAENLARWKSWHQYIERSVDEDTKDMLTTRRNIAYWTRRTGDATRALALFEGLLPDCERVLKKDNPDILAVRRNIASCKFDMGYNHEALRLFEALLPDRVRVLGPDHSDTLDTRGDIAYGVGATGNAAGALELFKALLPDCERKLGRNHQRTLEVRHNIADWTSETGDASEALELFKALLPDCERELGPDHLLTLTTHHNIAYGTGQTGDASKALDLFEGLLPDEVHVLGPTHPDTLTTRHNIADWTAKSGDAPKALKLFEALLPDRVRVLGPDHPDTRGTRDCIEHLKDRQS